LQELLSLNKDTGKQYGSREFYHEKYTQILQAAMAWVRIPTFELNLQKWVCL
jgi:hypothetical protein